MPIRSVLAANHPRACAAAACRREENAPPAIVRPRAKRKAKRKAKR
jgi:hypothetical protein